ncbi:MAG: PAS domain S-box protein [Desulfobacula sp.]|nr:PAS domain S-box protein [Desulfobacula sp.]
MKSPMSIRLYLSIKFGIVAIVPVLIIAVVIWQFQIPQMRTRTEIQQKGMARAIAGQISAHLMGGERQLSALADYLKQQDDFQPSRLFSLLDSQCGEGNLFEAIYITAPQGNGITAIGLSRSCRSKREDLLGLDLSGRSFIHQSRSPETPLWSETFLSTTTSRLAVALVVPLAHDLIIGEITLDKLSELIRLLPVESGLTVLVLDGQNRVVADSQQIRLGRQVNLIPQKDAEGETEFAAGAFDLEGKSFLGTVVDIQGLGWKVLVAQPIEDAYKPIRFAFIMSVLVLSVSLALALAAAAFQAGNLSRLLRFYTQQAQAISQGNYNLQWPPSKTAELMNLGQSFKRMAQGISHREKALVESETRMRITLDSIGDAVITTDDHGRINRMNPMAEKLTGRSLIEASGLPLPEVFRIINAHTREPVANPVTKVLAEGKIIGLANHTLLLSKDGREYQIADSGAPIRDTDGQIVGVVLVFRDVTETYAREEKIRENERLLKNMTANVPGVVYQMRVQTGSKPSHTVNYVSPRALDIFGIEACPETFFNVFLQCLPPPDREGFLRSVTVAVDGLKPWRYEGRFVKPSGEHLWFSGHAGVRKTGEDVVFNGVLMDITERRQMEEDLRMTRFSFEKASVGIYRIGSDARIMDANESAARVLGYTPEEMKSLTLYDIDPLLKTEDLPLMWERLCHNKIDRFETIHRRKNGEEIPMEITSNLLEYDGRKFSISFALDISQRRQAEKEAKRLQEALSQSQKMEAVGTLAGGIAHDFNNILSAMIGFSELSLGRTEAGSPVHRHLQKILTAGLRARDLVRQILIFSRQDELKLRPLAIGPLVKETLKLLRSTILATIDISHDIREDMDPVMADPTQIHQIVMNLCTNAAHSMEPHGGRLNVTLSRTALSLQDSRLHPGLVPGDYAKLTVQDTGKGIPPELMGKIFDPYFTTKEKGKGTGLGLAVVDGIVRSYGGAVYVYSEPDMGTTFNVFFPTVKTKITLEKNETLELPRGDEHILLVDDEPALLDVGQQLLEQLGYRVSTAVNGETALDLFCSAPQAVDLVITDMIMPKMTGDRLAVELLKIRPGLPIVLSTGYSMAISKERALEIGVKAFIFKPVVEAELAGIIRAVLDEARQK